MLSINSQVCTVLEKSKQTRLEVCTDLEISKQAVLELYKGTKKVL